MVSKDVASRGLLFFPFSSLYMKVQSFSHINCSLQRRKKDVILTGHCHGITLSHALRGCHGTTLLQTVYCDLLVFEFQ